MECLTNHFISQFYTIIITIIIIIIIIINNHLAYAADNRESFTKNSITPSVLTYMYPLVYLHCITVFSCTCTHTSTTGNLLILTIIRKEKNNNNDKRK